MILTNEQTDCLEKLNNFVKNFEFKNNFEYLVQGYAGTGKTTIINNLLSEKSKFNKFNKIYVLAPTNKAKLVISEKIKDIKHVEIKTIHSTLYKEPTIENEYKWELSSELEKCLLIVDECSMIDKKLHDDIKKACKNCLIIYLGDIFQLEAIGENSTIFDLPKSELTEVKRQDNSILTLATKIRTDNKNYYCQSDDISILSKEECVEKIAKQLLNNENSVLLVATNKTRMSVNDVIRTKISHLNIINKKDRLIAINNTSHYGNGELFEVNEFEHLDTTTVIFKPTKWQKEFSLLVHVYKINDKICFVIKTDKPSLYTSEFKNTDNLLNYFKETVQKYLFKINKHNNKLSNNLIDNIIICTYGYVISTHKSQGSQFDNVFINQDYCADSWNSAKWFYTAVTRAIKTVNIVPNSKYQTFTTI